MKQEFVISSSLGGPRRGFSNFTWTTEAIDRWEAVWSALWKIGIKWEWQNRDPYARRRGNIFNVFAVHDDAVRLDMAVPLPGREIVLQIHEHLLDLPPDDPRVNDAINLIRKWIRDYVE